VIWVGEDFPCFLDNNQKDKLVAANKNSNSSSVAKSNSKPNSEMIMASAGFAYTDDLIQDTFTPQNNRGGMPKEAGSSKVSNDKTLPVVICYALAVTARTDAELIGKVFEGKVRAFLLWHLSERMEMKLFRYSHGVIQKDRLLKRFLIYIGILKRDYRSFLPGLSPLEKAIFLEAETPEEQPDVQSILNASNNGFIGNIFGSGTTDSPSISQKGSVDLLHTIHRRNSRNNIPDGTHVVRRNSMDMVGNNDNMRSRRSSEAGNSISNFLSKLGSKGSGSSLAKEFDSIKLGVRSSRDSVNGKTDSREGLSKSFGPYGIMDFKDIGNRSIPNGGLQENLERMRYADMIGQGRISVNSVNSKRLIKKHSVERLDPVASMDIEFNPSLPRRPNGIISIASA